MFKKNPFENLSDIEKKKLLIISIFAPIIIIIVVFAIVLASSLTSNTPKQVVVYNKNEINVEEVNEIWKHYKEINEDYVGQIIFDSGLIDKPFVQAKSCYRKNGDMYTFFEKNGDVVTDASHYNGNDVYLWMDFETMEYDYDKNGGSIFMDYRNSLDDQNVIIYGHFFSTIYGKDKERVKAFTPLEVLLDEKYYQGNMNLSLVLEHEIRRYELFAVYKYDMNSKEYNEKGQYFRTYYDTDVYSGSIDDTYMKNYIDFVNKVKLYDTGVELTENDKTLTFQTCMTPYTNLYEICVFRLVK